ncbi:unnamed protein product [Chrysoparadoxa australica]
MKNADSISSLLPTAPFGVGGAFLLQLGLLTQVFGGGIPGNMMHQYEGWQVAEFRNPVVVDQDPIPISKYNNAWLRCVTYTFLFSFQMVGLLLFSIGVFGLSKLTGALTVFSGLVAIFGPYEPMLTQKIRGQPVFPLPTALFVAFLVNAILNLLAYYKLFSGPWRAVLAGRIGSGILVKLLGGVLAVLPALLAGGGGIVEGAVAESTFNQVLSSCTLHANILTQLSVDLLTHLPLVAFSCIYHAGYGPEPQRSSILGPIACSSCNCGKTRPSSLLLHRSVRPAPAVVEIDGLKAVAKEHPAPITLTLSEVEVGKWGGI